MYVLTNVNSKRAFPCRIERVKHDNHKYITQKIKCHFGVEVLKVEIFKDIQIVAQGIVVGMFKGKQLYEKWVWQLQNKKCQVRLVGN